MRRCLVLSGAILAAALGGQYASAQTPAPQDQAFAGAPPVTEDIDPVALSALEKMTLHLGTLKDVEVGAIGSTYYSLPPSCAPRSYNSISYYYYHCGGYQPAYSGTSVTYTVVNAPY